VKSSVKENLLFLLHRSPSVV